MTPTTSNTTDEPPATSILDAYHETGAYVEVKTGTTHWFVTIDHGCHKARGSGSDLETAIRRAHENNELGKPHCPYAEEGSHG